MESSSRRQPLERVVSPPGRCTHPAGSTPREFLQHAGTYGLRVRDADGDSVWVFGTRTLGAAKGMSARCHEAALQPLRWLPWVNVQGSRLHEGNFRGKSV